MDTAIEGNGRGMERADPLDGAVMGVDGDQDLRLEDLAQMIGAYNDVTSNLRNSYDALKSEVVRLQGELAGTNARLQRSKRLAALGEMAAGIAHEIRNPLAAIQLFAEVLAKDLAGASGVSNASGASATAQKIVLAVRGLNGIVNDVLSFAREIDPQTTTVGVSEVFDRAVEACRPDILAGRVTVRRADRSGAGGGSQIQIQADPGLLHQVLVNLIRNAVEAMRDRARRAAPDGVQAVLTLDAERDGQRGTLIVRDTGAGIAETDIDRIFNPFFTTRNTGTGLGLAIVHRIIDTHDGTIGVHNDHGAVFTLDLPLAADDAGVGHEDAEVTDEVGEGSVRREGGRLEPVGAGSTLG